MKAWALTLMLVTMEFGREYMKKVNQLTSEVNRFVKKGSEFMKKVNQLTSEVNWFMNFGTSS